MRAALATRPVANRLEMPAALVVVFLAAIRYRFSPDIPVSFLLALVLAPIGLSVLRRFTGARAVALLALGAAATGWVISAVRIDVEVSSSLLTVNTVRVLSVALVLALLLWARTVLGIRRLVLTFGVGSLASLAVTGLNLDNIWKFNLSVPLTLILLCLPKVYGDRKMQVIAVLALSGISAFSDSRSMSAMLLITAALTLLLRPKKERVQRSRAWMALSQLAILGAAIYLLVQAVILEGLLGESVRARTEAQIETSGSAIVGGRPEMGATGALIGANPWGYGSGSLAGYQDVVVGKTGMSHLGYDPNNGYVERYMFGNGFEVHSVLGDLWIVFGPVGAVLGLAILGYALYSLGSGLASGLIASVVLFLGIRLVWDLAFSPFPSAMAYLPLTLAVLLPTARAPDDPGIGQDGPATAGTGMPPTS